MRYPPYPEYKDSGVQWLGQVPGHWGVKKLGHTTSKIGSGKTPSGGATTYLDEGVMFLRSQNIHDDGMRLEDVVYIDEAVDVEMENSRVQPLDILLNITGASLGRTCIVPKQFQRANVNQHVCIIRQRNSRQSTFVAWLLKSAGIKAQIENAQTGAAREGLNFEQIGNLTITLPPLPEQIAIAGFLDRATGRIDTLVAKKRRLIALLKEKRAALIFSTVTRGLPEAAAREFGLESHTRLKNSDFEWLGEVPGGWDIVPLGFLVTLRGGATPDRANVDYWGGAIPWVSPKDMKVAKICDAQDHVSEEALRDSALVLLPVSSVLVVVRGMILAHSFPVALTTGLVTINQDMKAMICSDRLSPEYLMWLLAGFSKVFVSLADESAHGTRKLETATLTSFPTVLPEISEQTAIATYLARETARIDRLAEKVEAAIARLQEYRTALITAAVTGKIDVREAVS